MVNVLVTVRSVSGTIDVVWFSMAVGCHNSHAHINVFIRGGREKLALKAMYVSVSSAI